MASGACVHNACAIVARLASGLLPEKGTASGLDRNWAEEPTVTDNPAYKITVDGHGH